MFLDEHIQQNMSISISKCTLHLELTIVLAILWTVAADNKIPYFTQEPTSAVIPPGASLTLPCRVHPPDSVVRWFFLGEIVENENSYGFKLVGTDLVIPSLPSDNSDYGVYQCLAQNSHGSILSRRAKISKAVLRRFEDRGDLYLNVTEGSNIVLPCQPPYSRPKAKIMFTFNGNIIDHNSDHYEILPSGNLQIINITTKDQGQYQCMAHNELRNRTRVANHIIYLQVLNTVVPNQEPAVIMPTAKVHALVGQDVILECSAVGNPQPVITWEKYGGKMNYARATTKNGNLHIQNITVDDEGTYLCKANNGLNSLMLDGLKAMMLEISEPPMVHSVRKSVNVSIGSHLELECITMGKPKPQITWYHNGQYLKHSSGESKMVVRNAKPQHKGLYQCSAENVAGIQYSTMEVDVNNNKVDSGSLTLSDQNVTKSPPSGNKKPLVGTPAGQDIKRRRHKKKKSKKRKKNGRNGNTGRLNGNPDKIQLIPPNKPEVKQLSDTSVMLNWTVPNNTGLKIIFFRVQYKKVAPTKEDWYTDDIEIDSHIRMYEVRGLKSRATYKFRIAAVYSNNDNKHGPNSDRFEMKADPQPEAKPPSAAPTIVEVTAIDFQNIHGLNVRWQYISVTSSPIEGFFIFYKPYHPEEAPFQNVTLLEPSVRAHLLTKLLPSTEYAIKMQSFNSAGKSAFSNQVVEITKGPDNPYPKIPILPKGQPQGKVNHPEQSTTVSPTQKPSEDVKEKKAKSSSQTNSEKLYLILGIILGVMMLLLIVFIFMCWWKQRQQRRMMDAMNDAVRTKFQDPSQRIYTDSMRKKLMNGSLGMNGINGTIANGHIPRNYHKMNINVNPLSEMESLHSTDGSNHFSPTSFHPNGSVPGHYRASDNNCNNINQSKPNYHLSPNSNCVDSLGEEGSLVSHPSQTNNVPIGNHCDSQERHSNRSYDHNDGSHGVSCDPCDSSLSYDDTGGVGVHSGRHRKRRRRLPDKEQTTKDQATNTDLSSNEGTMDLSAVNKASSSSQESNLLNDNTRTLNEHSQPSPEYPGFTDGV